MNSARMSDICSCICTRHEEPMTVIGIIISGTQNVMCNNLPQAIMGGIVVASCGHLGIIASGSPNVMSNNSPTARLGDVVAGDISGSIISGSPNVFIN